MSNLSQHENSLFAWLPRHEARLLHETLCRIEFPSGTIIMQEGDNGEQFYIVLEGELEVVKAYGTDHERLVGLIGPGEIVGEMSLLTEEHVRTATVRARTPVQVLEISRGRFESLLEQHPQIAYPLLRVLSTRLRDAHNTALQELQAKHQVLVQAYADLQNAQAQIMADVQLRARLDEELRVARLIQHQFLPAQLQQLPGWQLTAAYRPARAVGGDFYDVIPLPDGSLGLVIGDVSGKGMPAALIMARIQTILRGEALLLHSTGKVLEHVNRQLIADLPDSMFVTCLYGILDPISGDLQYANAGHLLPYVWTNGEVVELRARGTPIGWFADVTYEEQHVLIAPGTSLLLHSDGLVEAHSPAGEMFGFERLRTLLARVVPKHTTLPETLLDELAHFTSTDMELEDDITLVHLHRLKQTELHDRRPNDLRL